MSRYYTWRGDVLVRRQSTWVHEYTAPWLAARQRRSQSRTEAHLEEQPRGDGGFIIKRTGDGTRLHDPGRIDRYLWVHAHNMEDE